MPLKPRAEELRILITSIKQSKALYENEFSEVEEYKIKTFLYTSNELTEK